MKQNNIIVNVRKARKEDFPAIAELYKQEGWFGDNNSIEKMLKNYNYNSKYNYLFVADHNGKIIGTITCSINKAYAFNCMGYMTFDFLIVDKQYRRKGVGVQLIAKLDSIAKKNNLESIQCVSTASKDNAHKFYDCVKFDDPVKGFRKVFIEE